MKESIQKLASLVVMFVLFPVGFGTGLGILAQCVARFFAYLANDTFAPDTIAGWGIAPAVIGFVVAEIFMATAAKQMPQWPPNIFGANTGWKKVIK